MRRAVVLEVIRLIAPRIPKGGTARRARRDGARVVACAISRRYAREDFEVMRAIAEAAQFTPGLWLLNRIADLWLDAATTLRVRDPRRPTTTSRSTRSSST